jgi:hypothetical protein
VTNTGNFVPPQQAPTPVPFPLPTEQARPIAVFPEALDCPPVVVQPGPVAQQPTPVTSANPLPTPGVRGPVVLTASDEAKLATIFGRYPSGSKNCVRCADAVEAVYRQAGYSVEVVGVMLESIGGNRAPIMRAQDAKKPGQWIEVANTGYHEAVKLTTDQGELFIDALVYEHFGVLPVDWLTYASLWEYPEVVKKIAKDPPDKRR